MKVKRGAPRTGRMTLAVCLSGCLLAACTVVGPETVRSGRLAYNEAIIETDNQQMLLAVVRNRYGERSNLLAVASVTANVSVTSRAAVEIGAGDEADYSGNLVPFSAGFIYEENPTISYIPVGGEKYTRQLMSPLPLAMLAQLAGTRRIDPGGVYYALVSSMNGLYNPDFAVPEAEPDPRYSRVVNLISRLSRAHRLHWVTDPSSGGYSIVIDHYVPAHAAEVRELLDLLGLHAPANGSAQIVLPVYLALEGRAQGGVAVITRSVFDLVEILTGAVEVSGQEQRDGVSVDYPPPGLLGSRLRVHRSESEPESAAVVVRYRDAWYWIDDRDQATKQYFRLLGSLFSVAINESGGKAAAAPVLTVPVSR